MNILLLFCSPQNDDLLIEEFASRPLYDWSLQAVLQAFPDREMTVQTSDEAVAQKIQQTPTVQQRWIQVLVDPRISEPHERELMIARMTLEKPLILIDGLYPLMTPELITNFVACFEEDLRVPLITADETYGESVPVPMMKAYPAQHKQSSDPVRHFACEGTTFHSPHHVEDKHLLEFCLRHYGFVPKASKAIKLLVVDSDGVLNDAGFYYNETAEVMKKFNTRDGAGIKMLQERGVEVRIITGEKSGFTPARAKKLGIERVEVGCSKKFPVLDQWRKELGLEWNAVAYMGDDLPDLECVKAAGIGACPANAEPELIEAADYVAPSLGGHGCVRDLIRHMIANGFV